MDKAAAARIQSAGARSKGHDTQAGSWEAKAQARTNTIYHTIVVHLVMHHVCTKIAIVLTLLYALA